MVETAIQRIDLKSCQLIYRARLTIRVYDIILYTEPYQLQTKIH